VREATTARLTEQQDRLSTSLSQTARLAKVICFRISINMLATSSRASSYSGSKPLNSLGARSTSPTTHRRHSSGLRLRSAMMGSDGSVGMPIDLSCRVQSDTTAMVWCDVQSTCLESWIL